MSTGNPQGSKPLNFLLLNTNAVPPTTNDVGSPPLIPPGSVAIYTKADKKIYGADDTGTETSLFALPIGGASGTLQFNNSGAFGGVSGSVVGAGGTLTLSPASGIVPLTITPVGTTNTGLIINNMTGATVGLSIQRFSSTGDAVRVLSSGGATQLAINADIGTGPILKITSNASGEIPFEAGYIAGQGAGGNVVAQFLTNGTTIVSKFYVAGSGGIATIGALTPGSTMSLSPNGTIENYIAAPAGGNELQFITGQLATPQGMRLFSASIFGTNDAVLLLSAGNNNGWGILEASPVTAAGLALSTPSGGGGPISIRPNRVESVSFPAAGGMQLVVGTITKYNGINTQGFGVPGIIASVAVATTNVGVLSATAFTGANLPAGRYRITWYANTNTTLGAGPTFTFRWTDNQQAQSIASAALGTAVGSLIQGTAHISHNGSANITYEATTNTSGTYSYYLNLERLA